MAKEPDHLVLVHLREMRAKIDAMDATKLTKFDSIDRRFDDLDKTLDSLKVQMTYTYGAAGIANMTGLQAEAKADDIVARQKKTDARVDDLDRRLLRVEEPSGV